MDHDQQPCGCFARMLDPDKASNFIYCPLHAAASELLEVVREFMDISGIMDHEKAMWALGELVEKAEKAMAHAEGKEVNDGN